MTKRRTILGLTLLALGALTLAVAGGGLSATDDITSNVTIEPHPNNGQYVVATGTDAVAIDVSAANTNLTAGVNDGALTRIDDAVLLTNDREDSVGIWTTDASDDVTFYQSTASRPSIEGSDNAAGLAPGETLSVGFALDTTGSDSVESLQEVTFHVSDTVPTSGGGPIDDESEQSPYVIVDDADGSRMNASVVNLDIGNQFRIDGNNTGYDPLVGSDSVGLDAVSFESAYDGPLGFNLSAESGLPDSLDESDAAFADRTGTDPLGAVTVTQQEPPGGVEWIDSQVTVDADAATPEDVRFYRVENGTLSVVDPTYVGREDGEHVFTFRSERSTRLLVAVDRPSIAVSRARLNATSVPIDGTVNVTATVVNEGARGGTYVADLLVDGDVVDSRALAVPAESSRQIAFQQRFGVAGTYEIRVESVLAGRLDVTNESSGDIPGNVSGSGPPSSPQVTPDPPTGPPSPPTPTPTPEPTVPPPTTESESGGIFDLSNVDGPAALALSGMIVFVVLGILYYIRRRLRDDEDENEGAERPIEDDDPTAGDGGYRRDR